MFFARDDVDMNVGQNSSFRKDVDEGDSFSTTKVRESQILARFS